MKAVDDKPHLSRKEYSHIWRVKGECLLQDDICCYIHLLKAWEGYSLFFKTGAKMQICADFYLQRPYLEPIVQF